MHAPRLPSLVSVLRNIIGCAAVCSAAILIFGGCSTTSTVQSAQHAFDRALRVEPPSAFFGPMLARAAGDTAIPALPPAAKQHYLSIILYLEGLSPRGEDELRREGLLGEAHVLRGLAQWRLGRLAAARTSVASARSSQQDALDQRERVLFRALEGALQLDAASTAAAAGESYEKVFALIAGPDGAWRAFGNARSELGTGSSLRHEVLQSRLAAFKVAKDARERLGNPPPAESPEAAEAWSRLRAEAQIELAEFAALPSDDAGAHSQLARKWQLLCGLDSPMR
jgi:hypothetical protein